MLFFFVLSTPPHQCGAKHKLQYINLFENDGRLNGNCGDLFAGLHRFEAREKVIAQLEQLGLYRGKAANKMVLGICSRSKDIIEPVLRPQWYVDCQQMAKKAVAAVADKSLKIIPEFQENIWNNWLNNIQDWCVSRQLWWGHRIPAYNVRFDGEAAMADDDAHWFTGRSEAEAQAKAEATGRKVVEIRRKKSSATAD